MAVYIVTGSLGSGKTLMSVGQIQETLFRGGRVATNLDLNLEHVVNGDAGKARRVTRIADWPTMRDFELLGHGDAEEPELDVKPQAWPKSDDVRVIEERIRGRRRYSEKKFGLIVLDEAAIYFNSRAWNEKNSEHGGEKRNRVIAWLRHARKFGWDVIIISQDLGSLDKQVREGLGEHVVLCRRMDRLAVPIIGGLVKLLTLGIVSTLRLPQIHVGVVRYGTGANAPMAGRWTLGPVSAKLLHGAYDTRQRILGETDGPATMLDARHAPYLWEPRGWREWLWKVALWRFSPASEARNRREDFLMFKRFGAPIYNQAAVAYREWLSARRISLEAGREALDSVRLEVNDAPATNDEVCQVPAEAVA